MINPFNLCDNINNKSNYVVVYINETGELKISYDTFSTIFLKKYPNACETGELRSILIATKGQYNVNEKVFEEITNKLKRKMNFPITNKLKKGMFFLYFFCLF